MKHSNQEIQRIYQNNKLVVLVEYYLVFQNFTMQQSRIVKKAALDLKNGRGDAKTNISKIAYYLAVQNIMFSALQQGLFAVAC
jgi:hypothetical protein